jgi:pimeloyl-ACP methyl ester carboxylesterase
MKTVSVLGLRLEYLDIPATDHRQPTLLMLHEGLGCISLWRDFPQQVAAATGARVIAWSRAGYGQSDPWPEARTSRYMHREAGEALPAFLAALQIDRPVLFGHSDGGSIALIFAGMFPEVPRGVIVMAPHEFVEEETLAGIREARKAWATTDWRQKLARYHADAGRVFSDWNDTWLSPEFRDWNIEEYLPKITCPVLAIQGEDDEYASMRQIEAIADAVPGTQLLPLANCGHSPQRDQLAKVISAVVGFTSSL